MKIPQEIKDDLKSQRIWTYIFFNPETGDSVIPKDHDVSNISLMTYEEAKSAIKNSPLQMLEGDFYIVAAFEAYNIRASP